MWDRNINHTPMHLNQGLNQQPGYVSWLKLNQESWMHMTKLQPTAPDWLRLLEFLPLFFLRKNISTTHPQLVSRISMYHFEYEMHRCHFFFVFVFFIILWTSGICDLVTVNILEKIDHYYLNIFLLLFFFFASWYSNYTYVTLFEIVPQFQDDLFFSFLPLLCISV